ncbi:MAG: peptidoglycan-associated lipoprotein Pal [Thermodesulfovibrionaceae bacterium]
MFKLFFIFLFFLSVVSCAERKIYIPEQAVKEKPQLIEEKPKEEIAKETKGEEIVFIPPSEIIKKLQQEVKDIHFDFDKYDIKQEDIPTLKKVASVLHKYPNLKLLIEGHCDERGTNEYNFVLGQKRANSAKQFLISLGVSSSRIEIISYGEEKPLCTEQNESCWQKNRRAHFIFIEEGK